MFRLKTVFIVGAGASCEAGLPSGNDLKFKIANILDIRFNEWGSELISGEWEMVETLRRAAREAGDPRGNINPYLNKAWKIRDVVPATAISIDNFLDAHQGDAAMELCGKLGIVKAILDAERASKLKPRAAGDPRFVLNDLSESWYVGFLQMLTEGVRKEDAKHVFDNVSIITFNYDRCIEHFLAQALGDYYDFSAEYSQEIVNKLHIFHPYGQVGPLPWQCGSDAVTFGDGRPNLLSLSRQIKTFTEGQHDADLLNNMREAVAEAEVLVFLGFAFHPLNMELLSPNYRTKVRRIYATTLGLSSGDREVVEEDILRMLGLDKHDMFTNSGNSPEMANMPCGQLIRSYFRSIRAPA